MTNQNDLNTTYDNILHYDKLKFLQEVTLPQIDN